MVPGIVDAVASVAGMDDDADEEDIGRAAFDNSPLPPAPGTLDRTGANRFPDSLALSDGDEIVEADELLEEQEQAVVADLSEVQPARGEAEFGVQDSDDPREETDPADESVADITEGPEPFTTSTTTAPDPR